MKDRPEDAGFAGELIIQNGRQSGARRPLQPTLTCIGRNPGCDIRLNVEGVVPFHCVIAQGPDGAIVRDLDSGGGTHLNGEPITTAVLRHDDVLAVGPLQFRVHLPAPMESPVAGSIAEATVPAPDSGGNEGWRVQVAAVAAQQVALAEEESKLQQRRKAFEKQEEQISAQLEEKRRRLMQLSERTQAERAVFEQDQAAFEQRMEKVTGDLAPAQREILDLQTKAQIEARRLVELNQRMRQHFRKKWTAEKKRLSAREAALAAETKALEGAIADLDSREADLAAKKLRFNALYELGRRHIKEGWDRVRLEQHRWKHRRGKERAALRVRQRDVENAEHKLVDSQKRFNHEKKSWEARRIQLEQEIDALETRVRNHRLKLSEHRDAIERLEAERREREEALAFESPELPGSTSSLVPSSAAGSASQPDPQDGAVTPEADLSPPPLPSSPSPPAAEAIPDQTALAPDISRLASPPALTPALLALHARHAKARKQRGAKQPGAASPAIPAAAIPALPTPATPQERAMLERIRQVDACAGELADQRAQLLEQWQRLIIIQDRWENERRRAGQEIEDLAAQLMEKGSLLLEREQGNEHAEQTLRRRHEELVQVRQHLIAWRSRLRVREKSWEGEREQLILEVRKREELANRQLNAILETRQRWNKRRRQEVAKLNEERQAIEALRQEFHQHKMSLGDRVAQLEEEKRIVSEKALAFEQYKQELLSKVETPLAERRIERLRRRWLTQNASLIRAIGHDRERLKEELAAIESRYLDLQKRADEIAQAEADLAEKVTAFEHKQTLAGARHTRLQDELKSVEAMRTLSLQQVKRMKDEVERIARSLIDQPDPPLGQAQAIGRAA